MAVVGWRKAYRCSRSLLLISTLRGELWGGFPGAKEEDRVMVALTWWFFVLDMTDCACGKSCPASEEQSRRAEGQMVTCLVGGYINHL